MPAHQLKKPPMTDQCTERLDESPVRNGRDMRNLIAACAVNADSISMLFSPHHLTSLPPISLGLVLVSLFLERNSSHSSTACLTVTLVACGLPSSNSFSNFWAFVCASDQTRVFRDFFPWPPRNWY